MKNDLKTVVILFGLIMFLFGCASTPITPFKYEYPEEALSNSEGPIIVVVTPKDERWQDYENDRIWSNDPVKEIGGVIQAELNSTGLFRDVLYVDKEDKGKAIERGADMFLNTSVMLLVWDVPFPPERDDFLPISSRGGLPSTEFTDLYGKVKILVTLVDKDTGKSLIDYMYYSSVRKTMPYLRTDLYGERKRVIGKALKEVIGQLKEDLHQLAKEGRI